MTMDYKKKYEEALERAKTSFENANGMILKKWLVTIFPELAASEDEIIRKELIDYFNGIPAFAVEDCKKVKSWIAWLENQNHDGKKWIYEDVYLKEKEQLIQDGIDEVLENPQKYGLEKQGTSYTKRDVDDAYLKGVTDTKNEIEKQYEANYQIRKNISTFIFNYRVDIKDRDKWMDYLGFKVSFVKGQGEKETLCANCRKEQPSHSCQDITALGRCAVEHEQKTTDKIEPKFCEGDWVVWDNKISCHIDNICQGKESLIYTITDTHNMTRSYSVKGFDNNAHLWTIEDAKDGDVLVDMYGNIGIYEKCDDFSWMSYCSLGHNGGFQHFKIEHENEKTYPATKEQCNLLFSKMEKAGWAWNTETKELSQSKVTKKSDQDDIDALEQAMYALESFIVEDKPDKCFAGHHVPFIKAIEKLKSLKERFKQAMEE